MDWPTEPGGYPPPGGLAGNPFQPAVGRVCNLLASRSVRHLGHLDESTDPNSSVLRPDLGHAVRPRRPIHDLGKIPLSPLEKTADLLCSD
jgi:hypothetical protein